MDSRSVRFGVVGAYFVCVLVQLGNICGWCCAVEIRRLSVPRWVQNGTEESVVLDCEYVYNENDLRLVVKWFFEDNLEPVYQWIPELARRHTSGVLQNRLDMDFVVNTAEAYSRYRALRIARPSTELSGKYTCLVTSLAGQDSREQVMTVFVPADAFDLSYSELADSSVNVTCLASRLYPRPILRLFQGNPPRLVNDARGGTRALPSGAYDAHVHRTFGAAEVTKEGAASVFECLLELPGTNYVRAKRIAYYPGIQSDRLDFPHSLSSPSSRTSSSFIVTTIVYLLRCLVSVSVFCHQRVLL